MEQNIFFLKPIRSLKSLKKTASETLIVIWIYVPPHTPPQSRPTQDPQLNLWVYIPYTSRSLYPWKLYHTMDISVLWHFRHPPPPSSPSFSPSDSLTQMSQPKDTSPRTFRKDKLSQEHRAHLPVEPRLC